jgi:hypothetical protein
MAMLMALGRALAVSQTDIIDNTFTFI